METRDVAVVLARGRIAVGLTALLAPGLLGRTMIQRGGTDGGTKLFIRMLGVREVALGLGVSIALDRGAPVRGWLEGSALADGADLVASLLARQHVRSMSLPGVVGVAGAATIANEWLSRRLDPAPEPQPGHPEAIVTGHPPERVSAR